MPTQARFSRRCQTSKERLICVRKTTEFFYTGFLYTMPFLEQIEDNHRKTKKAQVVDAVIEAGDGCPVIKMAKRAFFDP
ncbi:MAG TPA: hypothetical protein VGO59_12475 [Verrucomicrobiae bacterium]